MSYCLDSNVFIQSFKDYYAFDIAPPFWGALIQWGNDGVINCPSNVFKDLLGFDDDLRDWAKAEVKHIFHEPDDVVSQCFSQIADLAVVQFKSQQVEAFLDCSDPWVIAYAKANRLTVVTMEIFREEHINSDGKLGMRKIPIPNMCKKMDVKYINTYTFLRELNFSFR